MNHYHPSFHDQRQFNIPDFFFGQLFGPGGSPFPWQQPGFPPGGVPGGQPSGIPQQQDVGPPNTPPPPFIPQQSQVQTFAVDPGGIRGCLFRFTYIWATRDAFWFFPTFVGRNSIAGFRWQGNRWVYFGLDLNRIQSFQCF